MNRIPDYRLADVFFPGDLPREELLSLPVSITSWIILREYAETHADCAVFRKILTDYWAAAPLWEMVRVIDLASFNLKASEFEWLINSAFEAYWYVQLSNDTEGRCLQDEEVYRKETEMAKVLFYDNAVGTGQYCDLHSHTLASDGSLTPEELCRHAIRCGISTLAITDHNLIHSEEELEQLAGKFPNLTLISGCEASVRFDFLNGEPKELHLVLLFVGPSEEFDALFARVREGHPAYMAAILKKLKDLGIDLGTYEDLMDENPDMKHVGRMAIAEKMVRLGFVKTRGEAFDSFFGDYNPESKPAYTPKPVKNFPSLQEIIVATKKARGIAILAHPYSYNLTNRQLYEVLTSMSVFAGISGGMECEYADYDEAQRKELARLAGCYSLLPSAAGDFHSYENRLDNHFPASYAENLIHRWMWLTVP